MCKFSARSASIQGKNVQSVCDKISWCVALLALLRRERFCIGCKGGRAAAFLAAPENFYFRRVRTSSLCSACRACEMLKKCAFGRLDTCRYSREPTFQSSSKGLSKVISLKVQSKFWVHLKGCRLILSRSTV